MATAPFGLSSCGEADSTLVEIEVLVVQGSAVVPERWVTAYPDALVLRLE